MNKILIPFLIVMNLFLSGCIVAPRTYTPVTKVIVVQEPCATFVPSYIQWNMKMGGHPHDNRFRWRR